MTDMRVVHVSTHDLAGGAARAAHRIHRGLEEIGIDSVMLVAVKGSRSPSIVEVSPEARLPARVHRWRMRRKSRLRKERYRDSRPGGYERFSDDQPPLGKDLITQHPAADIIHLHSVADLLDYDLFFRDLRRDVPIVWTLHDMNPFTGGCHYD